VAPANSRRFRQARQGAACNRSWEISRSPASSAPCKSWPSTRSPTATGSTSSTAASPSSTPRGARSASSPPLAGWRIDGCPRGSGTHWECVCTRRRHRPTCVITLTAVYSAPNLEQMPESGKYFKNSIRIARLAIVEIAIRMGQWRGGSAECGVTGRASGLGAPAQLSKSRVAWDNGQWESDGHAGGGWRMERCGAGLRAEMQRNFSKFADYRGILMFSGAQLRRNFGKPAAQLRGHSMHLSRYGSGQDAKTQKGPSL
jgi:hypothetical protein